MDRIECIYARRKRCKETFTTGVVRGSPTTDRTEKTGMYTVLKLYQTEPNRTKRNETKRNGTERRMKDEE